MTDISIVTVEEQPLLAARTSATFTEIPAKLLPLMERVGAFVREHGVEGAAQNVWFYREVSGDRMEVDVAVRVPASTGAADGLVRSATPAGRCAHAVLYGDYSGIPGVHQAIHRWCAEQNLVLAGPCWEVYGDWHEDPAKLRTDMYHLLA
ncbi:MAG: GyrI-like domain-containing protein [Acidobacteriota bacterium]|nr:GyrI-like domain-containing protein [Acidobacteriota bacterium]